MSADVLDAAGRSRLMSRIRGSGNASTELRLIRILREARITGWRRGLKLAGRPDFVFPRSRVAVFVDGCFWHGCPVHFSRPRTNRAFWLGKIADNRRRDRRVSRELRRLGWRVARFWEHDLDAGRSSRVVGRLRRLLDRSES